MLAPSGCGFGEHVDSSEVSSNGFCGWGKHANCARFGGRVDFEHVAVDPSDFGPHSSFGPSSPLLSLVAIQAVCGGSVVFRIYFSEDLALVEVENEHFA
jgi:hypothetical protein